ncbi:C25 family cysteine peptidase [Dyadobacter sp. CY347]|uniref:putative type IX secretion system sortase PorU2 n=1 Tax=Dyadobacter sp. CY347 TaxID=2909336 RepID=UPI001F4547C4|nr:C25 family cysteine peptidase [Dyadobacter sp. CY347]MCF2491473.1 C25 family cysteine peptidase [Dyadobacter sp. CY347]
MSNDTRILIKITLLVVVLLSQYTVNAQWGPPYASDWINYDQAYVKIGIAKKGIHKIAFASLPKDFPISAPEKLQLWRRGKQVSIISTANQEILFYGVPNDGASDSLLYRPMSSRINPYFSMYSDEGSYFLTVGDSVGERTRIIDKPADSKMLPLMFHNEIVTTVFKEAYTLSTAEFVSAPDFLNSFFEFGASRSSKIQDKDGAGSISGNLELKNLANTANTPSIKLLIHGRSNKEHKIEVHVGKNAKSLRLVDVVVVSGFSPMEYTFTLRPEDVDAANKGLISLKSVKADILDRFSLTYFSVEFPQLFQTDKLFSKEFRLDPVANDISKILFKDASPDYTFLDISSPDKPIVLKGSSEGLLVPRQAGKTQLLLAAKEIIDVNVGRMKLIKFKRISPKESNYIIVTTDSLFESATQYANYRESQAGGGFKTLVIDIQDVYNKFNYGEPSPVAIRKFMSYMLLEGGKDKYLFIIGKSITHNEKMKRELPGEVPTIGYPASDMLLVEGIAGAAKDVPAMPVGRLTAFTNQHVTDYLKKVKNYESNIIADYGWRKNVLHLNGGKTVGEILQLKGLLSDLESDVMDGQLGGNVKHYVKQQAMAEPESVNITADVNTGVGLITFFGHGSTTITDLDMGYISDAARNYNNLHKYPLMYFNGCGVGNIFSGRSNQKPKTPKSNDRIPLSLDWLLAPDRGAIAIVANSFESYVSPSAKYLQGLYHFMFTNLETSRLPIGKIMIEVANDITSKSKDKYSIANAHQTILQGDPALRLLTVDKSDYAIDPDESISLLSESVDKSLEVSDSLKVLIKVSNNGRFIKGQNIPIRVTYFGKNKVVKTEVLESFPAQNTFKVIFYNSKDIQKIQVQIDPDNLISELNSNNNFAELNVDWDLIKMGTNFSSESAKDVVPPLLTVKFNDRLLKHKEHITADPKLSLYLSDDRQLFPDSSLVEIFIKHCGDDNCDFQKITYADNDIEMAATDFKSLKLDYATDLKAGIYEILVNAKDRAGNAVLGPYRMQFEISDDNNPSAELVVSPNPASSYLRFEIKTAKNAKPKSIRSIIYDHKGIVIEDKTIQLLEGALTNEWYWLPNYPLTGAYIYKVFLINDHNESFSTFSGNVILQGAK